MIVVLIYHCYKPTPQNKLKLVKLQRKSEVLVPKYLSYTFYDDKVVKRPPLWSSGQSSWLQIRRPGFDSRH
jgi:hypothetical protein